MTLTIIGVLFVVIPILGMRERAKENRRRAEAYERAAIMEKEDKQFLKDFGFVLDILAERDMEIYKIMSNVDKKIKAAIERQILSTNDKSDDRRWREERLLKAISEHEECCEHIFRDLFNNRDKRLPLKDRKFSLSYAFLDETVKLYRCDCWECGRWENKDEEEETTEICDPPGR